MTNDRIPQSVVTYSEQQLRSLTDKQLADHYRYLHSLKDKYNHRMKALLARMDYVLYRDPKKNRSKLKKLVKERDQLMLDLKSTCDYYDTVDYEIDRRTMTTTKWWDRAKLKRTRQAQKWRIRREHNRLRFVY